MDNPEQTVNNLTKDYNEPHEPNRKQPNQGLQWTTKDYNEQPAWKTKDNQTFTKHLPWITKDNHNPIALALALALTLEYESTIDVALEYESTIHNATMYVEKNSIANLVT